MSYTDLYVSLVDIQDKNNLLMVCQFQGKFYPIDQRSAKLWPNGQIQPHPLFTLALPDKG